MRLIAKVGVVVVSLLAVESSAALAYENFIPLGTGYSADIDSLPNFESDAADLAVKSDVYETELYHKGRKAAEADSFFRRFQSDTELEGGDTSIDY